MARRKVIKRERILETAFELVRVEGFSKLTARHIANKMDCSTQPIYLEFKNMADLKYEVYEMIEQELEGWLIRKEPYNEDPVVSVCLGYIEFSTVELSLYRTLSVDNFGSSDKFQSFIMHTFKKVMQSDKTYKMLSIEKQEAIASQLWTMTTGIASGVTSGLIENDRQHLVEILQSVLKYLLTQPEVINFYQKK